MASGWTDLNGTANLTLLCYPLSHYLFCFHSNVHQLLKSFPHTLVCLYFISSSFSSTKSPKSQNSLAHSYFERVLNSERHTLLEGCSVKGSMAQLAYAAIVHISQQAHRRLAGKAKSLQFLRDAMTCSKRHINRRINARK